MGTKKKKPQLKEPWRKIHGVIWLIGIAILAWQDWWWPGILVLVALSSITEAILLVKFPTTFESGASQAAGGEENAIPVAETSAPALQYRLDLLPSECPKCSAPLRPHAVQWDHPQAAHCPYCGVLLPLRQESS